MTRAEGAAFLASCLVLVPAAAAGSGPVGAIITLLLLLALATWCFPGVRRGE